MTTTKIPLTQGYFALVDDDDAIRVCLHSWFIMKGRNTLYAVAQIKKKVIGLHRFIMNPPENMQVDHINGDGLDNRKCNLRICTRSQNQANSKSRKGSKYKGISWNKRDKIWQTYIYVNGETIYLGYYHNEIDAAKAYDTAALKYFGEFAKLNFEQ